MARLPFFHQFLLLCIYISAFSCIMIRGSQSIEPSSDLAIKAAYWPSYTASYMPISSINTSLFTHLLYAFADVDPQTFRVEPDDASLLSQFTPALHSLNPSIITLLGIGGGAANATVFSLAMNSSASRKSLIDSSIELARANGFQGLNIDWEYPRSEADMANFGEFLAEWREGVEREAAGNSTSAAPLLLTAAVYYASRVPTVDGQQQFFTYPIASINKNLDLVHIMSFDYHGSWENFTGEHTALSGSNTIYTTLFGLNQWIGDGLSPKMAIVGLATYGKSWTLLNVSETGIGAPAIGPGIAQPTSNTSGIFLYFEIVDFISLHNATVVYDSITSSAYCYAEQVWVGYDDAQTFATKLNTFQNLNFTGYFFWAVSYDVPQAWPLSTQASSTWNAHSNDNPYGHSNRANIDDSLPSFMINLLLTWVVHLIIAVK